MGILKKDRIKDGQEFNRIIQAKDSFANKYFVVYKEETNNPHWRLGLSVSKKIGKAHERVWVKRRIRQSINNLNDRMKQNTNLIVIARPLAANTDQAFIQKQIEHILKLAGVINE